MLFSKKPICVGPISSEIIESVYIFSEFKRKPIMLISSKNQIDYKNGYVNNWNTNEYVNFLKKLKKKYKKSNVLICRDHCGPGFNGTYLLKDTYKTIEKDIENNFDLIHIDFSKMKSSYKNILLESRKAIRFAISLNKDIQIEVGTDENLSQKFSHMHIDDFYNEYLFFSEIKKPAFFVVPTGSLVLENYQVGSFNKSFLLSLKKKFKKIDIRFKEHNADYLSKEKILLRKNIIDAINIAPQFGVSQTNVLLKNCIQYGINHIDFLNKSYDSFKWKKWLYKNTKNNKYLCAVLSGHYNFNSKEYHQILEQLSKIKNIREEIIESHISILEYYSDSFQL